MEISSHVNIDSDNKVDITKSVIEENSQAALVSSHNIVPANKEFTKEELDKWIKKTTKKFKKE